MYVKRSNVAPSRDIYTFSAILTTISLKDSFFMDFFVTEKKNRTYLGLHVIHPTYLFHLKKIDFLDTFS